MKILIIGGVAGGASAAARARRLDESAEIVVIERGHHPSFANCGLPYYVGGKIQERKKLLVAPVEMLRDRHRLDVRVRSEVVRIDREQKQVVVRDLSEDREYVETYDKLIIATGAAPFKPDLPGIDHHLVLGLRDLQDADRMHELATSGQSHAVIVGAGFIGIEVAENLVHRGMKVTIVELANQILPPWDHEMIRPIEQHLIDQGVTLRLGDSVEAFEAAGKGLSLKLKSGGSIETDFCVVSVGVRPESGLARAAGIQCGDRGGILVNEQMQTNDPDIYAVGDVTQVACFVSGQPVQIPLAGPANRQGRIAADAIYGRKSRYRGTQGTAIVGVFGKTAAMTGLSEKQLQRYGTAYEKIYIHPSDHAGYYPGAKPLTLKLLFSPTDGRILGAQCVGESGVDKRIDVLAMAIQGGMTVDDLQEVELCYAPQFGHAKDPINMAGFVASGVLQGDHPIVHSGSLGDTASLEDTESLGDPGQSQPLLLDVRSEAEFANGSIEGATNIPIEKLREHIDRLPRDRPLIAFCKVGQRGYLATRVLKQKGFEVANLSGGYTSWCRERNGLKDPS